jgi:hypothetical protein
MQETVDQNRLPTKFAQPQSGWKKDKHGWQPICHVHFKWGKPIERFRWSILSKEVYP